MLGTWSLKGFGKRSEDTIGANAESRFLSKVRAYSEIVLRLRSGFSGKQYFAQTCNLSIATGRSLFRSNPYILCR